MLLIREDEVRLEANTGAFRGQLQRADVPSLSGQHRPHEHQQQHSALHSLLTGGEGGMYIDISTPVVSSASRSTELSTLGLKPYVFVTVSSGIEVLSFKF